MPRVKFKALIEIRVGNPYVMVSKARAARIKSGWRKPLPVLLQIDGQPEPPWRINMMPVGDGRFYLYLHGAVRKASRTQVGDRVLVDVIFDSNEARARNVAKALYVLSGKKGRFMARDWKQGK